MFINKSFGVKALWKFGGFHLVWISCWTLIVAFIYNYTGWKWLAIPWLPLSVIGTAVAFYIGFKNNQAYDRLWEARKIWGAIVNSSRSWGSNVRAFVTDQFAEEQPEQSAIDHIVKRLIYRHIGWLYALRSQLLISTPWEHINQSAPIARLTKRRINQFGVGLHDDNITENALLEHLPEAEYQSLINANNTATQIIDQQSQDLKQLRKTRLIEDFRHMELQNILNDFYDHQGKCERIKKFPLPRQYGNMSVVFVGLFILLLPLGMVSEFDRLGDWGIWISVPFTVIVGWMYIMMELVGDYSENPFEGLGNDIPMLSLCRTIEIDLKEMMGEADLPDPIEAINGVLM